MAKIANFVGRRNELALLDGLWQTEKANLLILYGRRRVGKTRLLTYWLKRRAGNGLYWVAEPTAAFDQLRSFSQAIYNFSVPKGVPPAPQEFTYASWEQAFQHVAAIAETQRFALFIDEFTYMMEAQQDIAGTLQKVWDHLLKNSNILIVLSGSQMGLMQKQVLSYDAPLYGRATAQLKLQPLPYGVASEYFPNYTASDRVSIYSVLGGVPAYWERINPEQTVLQNVQNQLLTVNAQMQEEPRTLLQDFINDPYNYVGIMRGIARGASTQARIATYTGLPNGHMSRYLAVLQETGFVTRRVPVTELRVNSRRGRYFITDPYLRFYYHFLSAFQAKLALGEQEEVLEAIRVGLPQFIERYTWPELCREWLVRASAQGHYPVSIEDVGGSWSRNVTIEVVGLNKAKRQLVLGTCLWDGAPGEAEAIARLAAEAETFLPTKGKWSVYFVGFAGQGWQPGAKAEAEAAIAQITDKTWQFAELRLLDLEQVDADLTRWYKK